MIRSIYRCLEVIVTKTTPEGFPRYPLLEHEWTFYIFDTLIILPVTYLFLIVHPSRYLHTESAAKVILRKTHSATSSFSNGGYASGSDFDSVTGSRRRCSVDMSQARPWSFANYGSPPGLATVVVYGTAL